MGLILPDGSILIPLNYYSGKIKLYALVFLPLYIYLTRFSDNLECSLISVLICWSFPVFKTCL